MAPSEMLTRVAFLSVASAMRVSRRVAVIGGGSAGVVTARFLRRAGHDPEIFEAGSSFGGVWAEKPTNEVVYKGLQTNLPTVVMQSPDLDFASGVPSYVTKEMLGAYIEAYGREYGLRECTTFGATVTRVAPAEDPAAGGGAPARWTVDWTRGSETHSDVFDAVVVASGHYNEPYVPSLPGEAEWLAGDGSRRITHSLEYDDADDFRGQSVLVVGGRSSGVDIARMLHGVAEWVYVLEKKCDAPVTHAEAGVTHVPIGTRLRADGHLAAPRGGGEEKVGGPPVGRVVLATGYLYDFPFLDEAACGMTFRGERFVTPLHQHVVHASMPTLGFVGIPLSVPCPIPFFECQAAYLAEQWARSDEALHSPDAVATRGGWVAAMREAVGGRSQDLHYTSTSTRGPGTTSAWAYMRELIADVHATQPPDESSDVWLGRPGWEARLATVEAVYSDRASRYPTKPWHDDAYRRCEYTVDWASGQWTVDDSKAEARAVGAASTSASGGANEKAAACATSSQ